MIKYFLAISLSFFIFSLPAQEKIDSLSWELKEITISHVYLAGKNEPLSYQNISFQDIASRNTGQEPSFLLSTTPSMTVYSDAGSYQGYSYFRLRGIDQTRINMTLDGVPLNEPEDQGAYFSNYPDFLNSVSSIQIQRGIGTTKNGTASYAGSIDFSSPQLFNESNSTNFGIGYGSYNSYRVFGEHKLRKANKSLYLRASTLHSDGYKYRSANSSSSVFYGGGIHGNQHKFKLIGFVGNQQNEMAWLGVAETAINQDPRTNANTNEDDEFTQSHTQLQHQFVLNDKITISSSVYYNYLKGNYDFDLNNFIGLPSTDEMYNYAFRSHFTGLLSNINYASDRLDLTGGIHLNDYSRNHLGSEITTGELYENTGYKNEYSAFTKASLSASSRFLIFADLQYRYTRFLYSGNVELEELNWNFLNPKAGITYKADEQLAFYYSVGKTGREPTRNDLFGGWDDLQADENGMALLTIVDPERVVDHELGMRFSKATTSLAFNFYRMNFENEIVLNGQFGPNGLALNSNVEKSYRQGIELSFVAEFIESLKLTTNFSYNSSKIEEQSESFEPILTPSIILNQDIQYSFHKFEIGLEGRYQSSSFIDFPNENRIDSYWLLNLRASFKYKGYTFSGFINNLTNTRYFNNGFIDFDGSRKLFVQAPINFYGMVTYSF